uniref:Immunodominant envelope protein n=1 Tax=Orf virus TaxID=10258 RepID=A0A0C5D0J5_ORFV|nr:immunodominant envelope protein [Orf virus]AKJ66272.1 immunodominant envelope protein [Orf virus]
MDPPEITAYIIGVAEGRGTKEVFPTLPYLVGLADDPPKPQPAPAPSPAPAPAPAPSPAPSPAPAPAPKPSPPAPHPKGDHVLKAVEWKDVDSKDYPHFFTDMCKSTCPKEMQRRAAHHLNLWESISAGTVPTKYSDDDFILVVDNDMTFRKPEMVKPLIEAMKTNGWYMAQLKETYMTGALATNVPGTGDPELMVYPGGYDVSLDAYIINVGGMKKLYDAIIKDGGLRSGLLTEVFTLEKRLSLARVVLSGAEQVVYPEYYIQVKTRLGGAPSLWSLLATWLARFWPGAIYFLTTPLFSFMGLFDVDVVDVFILAYLLVLVLLLPNSRLLWFIAGLLVTAIV